MGHDTTLSLMSGGDVIVTYDLAAGGAYPTTGKVPASILYVGAPPVPLSGANPLPVSISSLPARSRAADSISAAVATDAVMSGTTALTPKFAAIAASSSGDNTIVAAVTAKKLRVLRFHLSSNGSVNAKFRSGGGTDLTGLHYLTQFGGVGGSYAPVGLFESAVGEALILNLSGAVAVGGVLTYCEV